MTIGTRFSIAALNTAVITIRMHEMQTLLPNFVRWSG